MNLFLALTNHLKKIDQYFKQIEEECKEKRHKLGR
jgi:hypothetical protein